MKIPAKAFLIFVMSLLLGSSVFAVDVYIDGEKVEYSDQTGYPFSENGTVLVPLSPTVEKFGADSIILDNPSGTAVVSKGGISVSCNTSEAYLVRNGNRIKTSHGLVWRGGPLYVPAEIFSAFDAEVSVGGSGVIVTKKNDDGKLYGVFGAFSDKKYGGPQYVGGKYVPENGMYLGCFGNGDAISAPESFSRFYGKDAAAFTVYADISDSHEMHEKELRYAVEKGKLVRFILSGIDFKNPDTEKIADIARCLENSGAKILFCPAYGKNCKYSDSFCEDAEVYKQGFIKTASVLKNYAPSVPVVWQVCTCAENAGQNYYPGDIYADHVETDMCKGKKHGLLSLQSFVSAYGYKKSILLETDIDGVRHEKDSIGHLGFFTYLPMKYPQIKAVFLSVPSASGELDGEYINAVRSGISGASYIEKTVSGENDTPFFSVIGNGVTVPASKVKISCGFEGASRVIYKLNGKEVSQLPSKDIPFEAEIDFSPYAGKTVNLDAVIYDSNNRMCFERSYTVNTDADIPADTKTEKEFPFGYAVIFAVGIIGIFVVVKKINDIFC